MKAKWFEFIEQMRSTDSDHTTFIRELYARHVVRTEDIIGKYKLLCETDFSQPDSVWLTAPVLVATNRERYTLTPIRAIMYAKSRHEPVIRWPRKYTQWAQQPSALYIDECIANDPCFYEYYVRGAPCHVTQNFNKYRQLLNGTSAVFHSLTMPSDEQTQLIDYQCSHSNPGEVITLQVPPTSVNIEIISSDAKKIDLWKNFTLIPDHIVLPICEGYTHLNKDTTFTAVHGSPHFLPSKVKLEPRFAVEASFAMTIHKAEGQTIPNAILALSKPPVHSLTYCHVYVAFSRVRGCENIRLLLNGDNPAQKWISLEYIDCLRPDKNLNAFFAGYNNGQRQIQWKTDAWNGHNAVHALLDS